MQEKLRERKLHIGGPLHATCAAYIDLLGQLEQQSYAVQAVAFWLVEYVYNKVGPSLTALFSCTFLPHEEGESLLGCTSQAGLGGTVNCIGLGHMHESPYFQCS